MKLFIYYVFHTVINTFRKLFKTWIAMFLAIMVMAGLLGAAVGGIVTILVDTAEEEQMEAEEEIVSVPEKVKADFLSSRNLTKADLVDVIVLAAFLLIVTLVLVSVNKGGELFKPADVTLLFSSPMKPQSVMMFRLMNSLGMNIIIGIYMVFQLPNLTINAGISIWGAFSILLAYMLTLIFSTLLQVSLYAFSRNTEKGRINIAAVLLVFYGVLFLAFFIYTTVTGQDILTAVFTFFGSKKTFWIPFAGWIRGMVYYAIAGKAGPALLYIGLFIVSCVLAVFLIWNMKADFYEDALFATERVAERMESAQRAAKGGSVTREKDRSDKLERNDFHHGYGASVFFHKAIYNRLRFATLKIFSKTMILYLMIAVLCAWLSLKIDNPLISEPFLIPAAALLLVAFYRSLGNPLQEDTSREFFVLIPDSPLKKIWASILGCIAVCALDLSIPVIAAAVMTKAHPLTVLGWLIYILSGAFFCTTVGAFVNISIPGEHARNIKTMVQVFFIYFGILPSAGFAVAGLLLHQMGLMLLIGAVFNVLIGAFFTLITPRFLMNR